MKRRSMNSVKHGEKSFKTLAVATIAGLSIIGVGQAQAVTLDEVDLSQKLIDTPTLDYLHDNNVLIPQKSLQRDEDGNIVTDANGEPIIQEGTPILAPQSGYSLTELNAKEDGSKPDGDNVITKFEVKEVTRYYDKTTGELVANPISGIEYKVVQEKDLVPHYYNVNTIIPESNNSKITWTEVTGEGDNTIKISSPDGTKYYKYTYNAPSNYDTTTNSNKTKDLGTFTNPTGTYQNPTTYKGGSAINNPAGSTITLENYVFQNNKTTADFKSTTSGYKYVNLSGGAIYNEGEISKITSDFIGNSISATKSSHYVSARTFGGAIYNNGKIGDITGDFIRNSSGSTDSNNGGAIYNNGTIGNITGDFMSNNGGAIYNSGTIGDITGDFTGNTADLGGAIFNNYDSTIGNITGDFIGNTSSVKGGAIFNEGTIGNITGDFIGNYTASDGGAIYNDEIIGNITGDFIGNSADRGGAIYNDDLGTIGNITGDFIGNYTDSTFETDGAAIFNSGTIGNITGDFIGNYADSQTFGTYGGAIFNKGTIGDITGDFIGNYTDSQTFETYGAAIFNMGTIGDITGDFIGNYAKSETGEAKGGAIYSKRDLSLVADNRTNTFKDNYTESQGVKDDNAIYIDNNATLNFTMKNNGKFYMADNIDGTATKDSDGKITDTYSVNIKGDDINNTTFYMLNDIRNANVTFDNTTINAVNNQTHVYNFNSLTVNSDTNFVADVDLANAEMDRITATNYGTLNGKLNVVGMNLLSDSVDEITEIYFAEQGLKDNVVNGMPKTGEYNLPSTAQTTFYTPIYKYNATYDNRDNGGYFIFDRVSAGNNSGNASDNFNPSVLAPSVASQAGANATMNQTFNYAFQNSDNFMTIPYLERISLKNANKYALSPTGDATDVGTFSPLFNAQNETSSAWVKPYASFENIPLKNGPKVSNITYGTLVGFDTPIKSIKHGWDKTWTGYIGYNGASQRFSGVDATQNGGLVGGTLTLYKGNFFNATTVSTGAIVGENRTMYGTDNYTMLMAGVGNKTGYNFEFKEGKIIIQPSMLLSYTFVNTFDYTNAAGVKIKNDPLNAIQIAPGVKFIANTKNGWQPYIGVNMIWNLLDKSKVSANDVRLPEMSIKPYVQYGVGVQKRFKDRYMAFGQAMIQNGGRNGISLTAGFRWAIGKEGKPLEKVQRVNNKVSSVTPRAEVKVANNSTVQPERKIIKQLSQTQRERIAKQYQNTTRTTSIGTLKQL